MEQRTTVGKLSSNFPLNMLFNHNAEHVCHKGRKVPLFSTGMHVAAVVCHYSEPLDRFSSWEADSALQALDRLSKIQMQLISLISTWNKICVQEEMVAPRTVTGTLQHTGARCWHQAYSTQAAQRGKFLHSLQTKMFSLDTNCMAAAG